MIDWFVLVLFSPLILLAATVVYLAGRWLRIMPRGPAGTPMLLLLACAGAVGVSLYGLVDATIDRPAAVQTTYLGRPYVGVLALRGYRFDIGGQWDYALSPETLAQLRPRCVAHQGKPIEQYCDLYLRNEGRSSKHGWIENGRLHLVDD